ncbi:hypothetical protein [Plantactinospora sonchi]|uniref:hypothetical protein n=1 Tax=Plantactinospora sonchi TaxID=1544735 RepID=UPI0038B47AC2
MIEAEDGDLAAPTERIRPGTAKGEDDRPTGTDGPVESGAAVRAEGPVVSGAAAEADGPVGRPERA